MSGEINELSQAVGRIEQKVDDLSTKFSDLPCTHHTQKIEELDAYKNKALGMVALMGLFFGFIGWILAPVINWLLDRFN